MALFSPNEWPRVALMRPDVRATLLAVMNEFERETGKKTYVPANGGYRAEGVQAAIYADALREGFRAAPPGQSGHEYGAEADLVIVGKPPQDAARDQRDPDYRQLADISRRHGLLPGFYFTSGLPDPYHHGADEPLDVMRAKWTELKKKGSSSLLLSPSSHSPFSG